MGPRELGGPIMIPSQARRHHNHRHHQIMSATMAGCHNLHAIMAGCSYLNRLPNVLQCRSVKYEGAPRRATNPRSEHLGSQFALWSK
eukprot:933231-Alexandrium_andersonii.AAC.1